MNYDEFSFVNHQLAAMLREGIPLEGALRQLVKTMPRSPLRTELHQLEADLSASVPLRDALAKRKLPDFYKQMVQVGMKTNDFPGILTLLADYYQRMNAIWIKLRGIMLYPLILLVCSLVLSLWIGVLNFAVSQQVIKPFNASRHWALGRAGLPAQADQKTSRNTLILQMFLPPAVMAAILLIGWGMAGAPRVRRTLRWHLPAFHEAHLAQFAAATELLLKSGCPLAEAVALLGSLERGSPMGKELVRWQALMAAGHGKIYDLAVGSAIIPPLFAWVVSSAGENLAVGFQRAAEIYRARAEFKTELLLYAALPCSILVMGLIILGQVYPLVINNYNLFQGIFRMSEILS